MPHSSVVVRLLQLGNKLGVKKRINSAQAEKIKSNT
jgi:hypothetical protein